MAPLADLVKVIMVLYEITETPGKDVRDFLGEGRTFAELLDWLCRYPYS